MFTIKGCSLIRGVHYERFHCSSNSDPLDRYPSCLVLSKPGLALGLEIGSALEWGGGGASSQLILVIKIILAIILRSGYYSGCRNPNNLFGG